MISDSYISISLSSMFADESKNAWVTGPTGPPGKIYFTSIESQLETKTTIFARMNAFADGYGVIDSTDFFIPRAAVLTEDSSTVFGLSVIQSLSE